jgi:hypothetical protein
MTFNPSETQILRRSPKIRSRHMLPMEMLAYLTLLLAGIAGAFPIGYLHRVIAEAGKATEWGFWLIPLAATGVIVSAAEWWLGWHWENGHLRISINARWMLSLLGVFCWGYITYVMMGLESGPVTSMMISACFVSPFHAWSFWVNLRCSTALDPKLKTSKLQARLEQSRDRW